MNISEIIEKEQEKASRMFGLPAVAAALEFSESNLLNAVRAGDFAPPESALGGAWRWSQAAIEYEVKKRYLGHEPCGLEINMRMMMAVEAAIQCAEKAEAANAAS
ncbi:MAG: hypothetical protein NTV11_20410 [Rhodocyclales bacterium]|nr:hypothetical protein [Rhodocyclales bacterium]